MSNRPIIGVTVGTPLNPDKMGVGADGVGIESIEQTVTSTEDSGENEITVTLTSGEKAAFTVRNGSKGNKGDSYNLTDTDKAEIAEMAMRLFPVYEGEVADE